MTRVRLTLEWDGRPFAGWQRQANAPSVQQTVEAAAARLWGRDTPVQAAGRTDAGVHALAMAAHCDAPDGFPVGKVANALNAHLRPDPVAVLAADAVADDWHARFCCRQRRYRYVVVNRRAPLTVGAGLAWRVGPPLDEEAMARGAAALVGRHDFTTFRSAHCQAESPVRTLDRLDVRREGERVVVEATARAFLHHQVRSMVGCLALVGLGRWSVAHLGHALEARDRTALGLNAPPDGLYFVAAEYDGDPHSAQAEPVERDGVASKPDISPHRFRPVGGPANSSPRL